MTSDTAIREAKARWARRRRRLIGYGQWQPFTDAAPVRAHVNAIRATGMSCADLHNATGVTRSTLDYLLWGDENRPAAIQIRTESARALLAYWPTLDDYGDGAVIDATGTRRRLQALAVVGWSAKALQQHLHFVTVTSIERARYNRQVTARLARAVRDLYAWASEARPEDHGVKPWVAERGRGKAARAGWHGPAAWDEDGIDDPAAKPYVERELTRDELAELRRIDVEFLAGLGHTPEQIAERLGDISLGHTRDLVRAWRTGQPRDRRQQTAA